MSRKKRPLELDTFTELSVIQELKLHQWHTPYRRFIEFPQQF